MFFDKLVTHNSLCLGHHEKANVLCFHPLASNILATAAYDGKIFIWNVAKQQVEITLDPIQEPVMRQEIIMCYYSVYLLQLFAMAWSCDGTKIATLGRDETIKIYEPRSSTSPIKVRNLFHLSKTISSLLKTFYFIGRIMDCR